jgi:hypothetical protein
VESQYQGALVAPLDIRADWRGGDGRRRAPLPTTKSAAKANLYVSPQLSNGQRLFHVQIPFRRRSRLAPAADESRKIPTNMSCLPQLLPGCRFVHMVG